MIRNFLIKKPDLDDKVIFLTGGTGTFGQHFVRVVLERYSPKKLIIFSRDEQKQLFMAKTFPTERYPCIRYFIGDVRDYQRLDFALKGVDIIVHAAAMKHVHIAEYNPYECIKTNVLGAQNLIRCAITHGVKQLIALSTDKAVSPINLYGATKLAAEKSFIAANNIAGAEGTVFSVLRYGNVVGSRGSIVPVFRQMIAEDADALPITDEKMSRFWISIGQAVDFVLSNLAMMTGGEIFIPKIPSMKMVDIAKALAPDLPIEIIGIRPGEKLHECMITSDESLNLVEMEDRYIIPPYFSENWQCPGMKSWSHDQRFAYVSHLNDEWLDAKTFLRLSEDG